MRKNFGVKTWIYPQPVLMLGTYDEKGTPNIMNAAWGGMYDFDKVVVSLSSHKTTNNLEFSGAFTLSIATKKTMVESDYFGIVSENNTNKIENANVKISKSQFIDVSIIKDYPLNLECKGKKNI